MKEINVVKTLSLIIRATGVVFWYNLLSCMFLKESTLMKIVRIILMISCLLLGYLSSQEKKKLN